MALFAVATPNRIIIIVIIIKWCTCRERVRESFESAAARRCRCRLASSNVPHWAYAHRLVAAHWSTTALPPDQPAIDPESDERIGSVRIITAA